MAVGEDGVIRDDTERDWGTRFVPPRDRSPVEHLGGMPSNVVNVPYDRPKKDLPDYDPSKAVVPPSNLPYEIAVQKLIEKVFSEKEQTELLNEQDLALGGAHGPHPTEAEAKKAAKLDEENQKKLDKEGADSL